MTQRFSREERVESTADELLCLMLDEDFQTEMAKELGALEVRCSHTEQGAEVVMTLFVEMPPKWGNEPDRSTHTTTWVPADLRASWKRIQHGHEHRSRAEGTVKICEDAAAGCCRIVTKGEVEIRVPLLGRSIEKKVVKALERDDERRRRMYRKGILELRQRRSTN
jgi:hypothetical protein